MLIYIIAFTTGIGLMRDYDVWWHLAAGELIVRTGSVPTTDPWSFTLFGQDWFAHEWLTEVLFHHLVSLGGLNALLVWKSAMGVAALAVVARLLRRAAPERGFAYLLGVFVSFILLRYHLIERPHLFTVLFLALTVLVLEADRPGPPGRRVFLLALLFVPWANVHGGVILGLGTVGLYGVGAAIDIWRPTWVLPDGSRPPVETSAGEPAGRARKRLRRLVALLGLCCLAALLNPRGVRIFTYPFEYLGSGSLASEITEWNSPDFRQMKVLLLVVLGLLVLAMAAVRRLTATEILLVLAGGHFLLQSQRNVVLLPLFVLPAAVRSLRRLTEGSAVSARVSRLCRQGDGRLLLALVLVAVSYRTIQEAPRITPRYFPEGAVEYLKANHIEGRMLNDFTYGGYLIYHMGDRYPVFLDSRTDLFFAHDVFLEYLALWRVAMGWQEVLDKHRIEFLVFDRNYPLRNVLLASGDWTEVFLDEVSTILVRRPPKGEDAHG